MHFINIGLASIVLGFHYYSLWTSKTFLKSQQKKKLFPMNYNKEFLQLTFLGSIVSGNQDIKLKSILSWPLGSLWMTLIGEFQNQVSQFY